MDWCTILTKMGIKVLYEEKNQTGALRRMAEKEGVTRMDHFGIYHIRGCQMKPWYGPAIRLEEKTDVQVIIKDFGTDWEDASAGVKRGETFSGSSDKRKPVGVRECKKNAGDHENIRK